MTLSVEKILLEDARRRAARPKPYDPQRGNPADPRRIQVHTPLSDLPIAFVPKTMLDDPEYGLVTANAAAWQRLRCRHDFEYWCAVCATIKDKTTGRLVRFALNAPQRRVVEVLERQRLAGRPLRLMLLKARQWGGSTLIQTYMAWIQSCLCRNWHSLICAQVKDTSSGIRGMYSKLIENYPPDLWEGDEPPRFRPFERSTNVREIAGRGCRVTVSSIENQDAVRGADFAMAHLSETAFWRETPGHTPQDTIRAICGSVALVPLSLIVMESTANGPGNYFHSEWLRCSKGLGDKEAVFVPWFEIEIYRLEPPDPAALAASLSSYEQWLWDDCHCALDQIYWYRCKRREYPSDDKMMAEFPSTDSEAFAATASAVFDRKAVDALRSGCCQPRRGMLHHGKWFDDDAANGSLWQLPAVGGSYVVAVDVGGRWSGADFSVVAVLRTDSPKPEIVAQWRGHIDHDILGNIALEFAAFYNQALLVVESNTLESGYGAGLFILNRLAESYPNIYRRRAFDSVNNCETQRVGFHTNRQSKEMIITGLIAAVRTGAYIERDSAACDELLTYELALDGSYAAKTGCHDDILMTRAIALHAAASVRPAVLIDPVEYLNRPPRYL